MLYSEVVVWLQSVSAVWTLWASCRSRMTVWQLLVYVCERFLCVPGKRDGREMANQRIAAVAVPCCTAAIPPCAGYISSRQFITWSAWLLYQRVAASCEYIDYPPSSACKGDQPISSVHARCFRAMMIIYGYNWDLLSIGVCMCVCINMWVRSVW